MREKVLFCWSGGKDSALALHRLRAEGRYEVAGLLTTCNGHYRRVSMHGVRVELLERQAAAVGLPLEIVEVSQVSSNEEYRQKMGECMKAHRSRGVTACVFGDIFLEDLRAWRESNLAEIGLRGIFPIWKVDSRVLMREFLDLGFGSILCCVNDAWLGEADVGRVIDEDFLRTLPADVDPCGENGEYHSFAFAGPIFSSPVRYTMGEKVYRPLEAAAGGTLPPPPPGRRPTRGFWFCDLLPA
ncbi:MAG TPA: hypothetical protein VFE31_08575 [Opitutaceae bacterium]|nr:hypothetical protein [Opitutaceae bacterium]